MKLRYVIFVFGIFVVGFLLIRINLNKKVVDDWDKQVMQYAFGDFNGDRNQEVAIMSIPYGHSEADFVPIKVYDNNGKLLTEEYKYRLFTEVRPLLFALKPDLNNSVELFATEYGTGAHGYELDIFGLDGNTLKTVGSSSGDGGIPDTDFLLHDYDKDGKLELLSLSRDWEKNSEKTNEKLFYSIENIESWSGTKFEPVSEENYNLLFVKITEKFPDQNYTKNTMRVK